MRKRKYVSLEEDFKLFGRFQDSYTLHLPLHEATQQESLHQEAEVEPAQSSKACWPPIPQCHNIVSTSQIKSSASNSINLQRLADVYPFTTYDRKRFAAITIRLANPHCTCLLFGSGKLVITGSTSFSACVVASHEITRILREANPREWFEVSSCIIQNIVAHVELPKGTLIDLNALYSDFCECSTYQKSIFPGLVLRPPQSPIVLLVFTSGRIVCTGGRSYDDIYYGFLAMFDTVNKYIKIPSPDSSTAADALLSRIQSTKKKKEVQ